MMLVTSQFPAARRALASWFSPPIRAACRRFAGIALLLVLNAALAGAAAAQNLVLNNVGNPTSVGAGAGKRAIWVNAGTVGATTVDLVATLDSATLNHTFSTQTNRAALTSIGVEDVWMTWRIYRAGTYDINTNSGGVPVTANIRVQLNDIDGPNNERAYVPICDGTVSSIRVQKTATTGRDFGTITGRPQIFSLIGDRSYNAEPESGVEALYPNTSTFSFGRRANNGFFIRVSSPTYTDFDTYDYQCADFATPVAVNDTAPMAAGTNTIAILQNDSAATGNPSGNPSEWGVQSVSLTAPSGATGIVVDANGHTTGFTVPGQGAWSYDDTTGLLSFTPVSASAGSPTPITYVFYNALTPAPGVASNAATVTLTAPLVATNDSPAAVDGSAGNTNVINAFSNDTSAGGAVDPSKLTTTITAQTSANVTLNISTGVVTVAPGTPSGTYTIDYQICEITLPANCSSARVTVPVVGGTIVAGTDGPYSANGTTGSTNAGNAYANDTLSGAPVDPSRITGTIISQTSPNVTLNTSTGTISVAPNTPAGSYTISYQICEQLNPANCTTSTVTVTVTAAVINATDEGPFSINGSNGSASVVNAFANDTLNGAAVNPSDITATISSQTSANVTMNVSTGVVSVAPNTPAGSYTVNYRICQNINPTNCDTAVVTVSVTAAPITASDEGPFSAGGFQGNPSVGNVFANDTVNGQPTNGSDVTTTIIAQTGPNVTLDTSTGVISVAPRTPAGTYTIDYQICQIINPSNCDPATVTVTVGAPPIDAVDDAPSAANGFSGNANVANVFANDSLDGSAVNTADVNVRVTVPASSANVQLNTGTGVVSVAAQTPAGNYTITYEICDTVNPTSCDTATITVAVTAAPINAVDDAPPSQVNGAGGNPNVLNIFSGDTLNGTALNPSYVTTTVVTPASNPNVALNPSTGTVSVAPGTPGGTYTIVYQICENLNPSNCDSATISVTVGQAVIVAGNDTPTASAGVAGDPNLVNVLTNDTVDGATATTGTVSIAVLTPASNPNVALDPSTGTVSVAPNTPAGGYTINYRICEMLNPGNCSDATITVNVSSATINAVNDTPPAATGAGNPNLVNVFANDTLNGAPVDPAITTATIVAQTSANVTMDVNTGVVSVAPGTLPGTYTVDYRVCEDLNPTNCDTATVTVTINPDLIDAVDDTAAPVSGSPGSSNAGNAFANDTLAGAPVNASAITATIVTPAANANVQLNLATGIVSVAPNTPQGTYTIGYRICQNSNPTNCDTATVTVPVGMAVIAAGDDVPAPVFSGVNNGNIGNAFANDAIDGAPVVTSQITASVLAQSDPNVQLNVSTGVISVGSTVPVGTYTIDYRICQTLNPANCDDAQITVSVVPTAIRAVDDAPAPVGSAGSANLGNAFDNDTLNGAPISASQMTATILTPASNANVAMNAATGIISVAGNTPAGTYTIVYQICETINPANCDDATITVTVSPAAIQAVNDAPPAVASVDGNANLGDAFSNDTLNGAPVVLADVTASVVTPATDPGVELDVATGVISVAPNIPAATYTIAYRICETINPANCSDATVTVVVNPSTINAVDDSAPTPFDSKDAIPGALNVLGNDVLNGAPATVSSVTVTAVGTLPAGLSLDGNGTVDIAKGTPSGSYSFDYRICEILNPATCDTATVTIEIRKSTPSISGYVYFDANGNGVLDPNEDHLPGYRVELRRNGQLVQQTISDGRGSYHFADFPPGDGYEIVFIDPDTNVAIGRIGDLTINDDTNLDNLNQPINPSGLFYNSATSAPLAGVTVELRTAAGIRLPDQCLLPNQQGQTTGADGRYRFTVVSGADAACPAGHTEYRLHVAAYPSDIRPQTSVVAPPVAGSVDASTCAQDAVPGGACQISAFSSPPQVGAPTPYYMSFIIASGDHEIINNHVPLDPVIAVSPSGLSITKRANVSVARRDDVVSYVIVAANDNRAEYGPIDVRDRLPAGLVMVPGSGSVDGTAVEPIASGRVLTFPGLTIPARGSVQIRLSVRIGADVSPGDYVNQAWIADPVTGAALTAIAKATVRLVAEHAFDCGEIIGKVFDDRNRDGIQSEGEKGLPGVRVVTVNGILITTDKHGRFSVPCAELPDQDIGSNFILKLDTRTLPDGYRVTTENPRVVRLTAGKVTKLNFGATAGNTIRVDVTGRAFGRKSAKPSGALADGIGRLVDVTDKKGAALKVTYTANGEPADLVDARVKNVRAIIAKVWRDRGEALPFEIRVVGAE